MTITRMCCFYSVGGALLSMGIACDSRPREPVAMSTKRDPNAPLPGLPQDLKSMVPRPDPAAIDFNSETNTLTLYDLPDRDATWMLVAGRNTKGEPIGMTHWFMDEVDEDATFLFYTTKSGTASPRITLRDVRNARLEAQANR